MSRGPLVPPGPFDAVLRVLGMYLEVMEGNHFAHFLSSLLSMSSYDKLLGWIGSPGACGVREPSSQPPTLSIRY